MRLRIFSAGVLFLFMSTLLVMMIPSHSEAVSYDPYDIPPGAPRWFDLEDFDQKGDRLQLTIIFKTRTENGTPQERPISFFIVKTSLLHKENVENVRKEALFSRENVATRQEFVGGNSIVNPVNGGMTIVFYNEQQDSDRENWDAAYVKVRVDYDVINKTEEESNFLLILILVILIIIILVVGIGMGYYVLNRRIKASRTFFNPDGQLYYVFRDIDGSVFYFTEDQYTHMYNQNALVTFEYLGQATKKGGPVMIPVEEQGMYEEGMAPIFAQPTTPVPLDVQMPPQTLSSAPPPSDQYQPEQTDTGEDLYGQDLYDQPPEHWEEEGEISEPDTQEGTPPMEGDGSGGVLDELVSSASTIAEEPAEEELIMRLGEDEGSAPEGE
ncbi:MAG: hypothetical protein ACMUHM_09590 [Thermoplasmatota archaeon]